MASNALLLRVMPQHRQPLVMPALALWSSAFRPDLSRPAGQLTWWELVDPAVEDGELPSGLAATRETAASTVELVAVAAETDELVGRLLPSLLDALGAAAATRILLAPAGGLPGAGPDVLRAGGFSDSGDRRLAAYLVAEP